MLSSSEEFERTVGEFRGLCDSVIIRFLFEVYDSCKRRVTITFRGHDGSNQDVYVKLVIGELLAWRFSCGERVCVEAVSEGVRATYVGEKWLIDMGSDPTVDTAQPDWQTRSTMWFTGKSLAITRLDESDIPMKSHDQ